MSELEELLRQSDLAHPEQLEEESKAEEDPTFTIGCFVESQIGYNQNRRRLGFAERRAPSIRCVPRAGCPPHVPRAQGAEAWTPRAWPCACHCAWRCAQRCAWRCAWHRTRHTTVTDENK